MITYGHAQIFVGVVTYICIGAYYVAFPLTAISTCALLTRFYGIAGSPWHSNNIFDENYNYILMDDIAQISPLYNIHSI